jgi:hypothetical protein
MVAATALALGFYSGCASAVQPAPGRTPEHSPPPKPTPSQATQPQGAQDLLARLLDPRAPSIEREQAAERLLLMAWDAAVAQDLERILFDEDAAPDPRQVLLAAIAQSWNPPPRLFRSLVRLTETPSSAPPDALLAAIAAYRTPDAAQVLIGLLSLQQSETIRAAAGQALISMSGRDDLGADRLAWQRWFNENRDLDEVEWKDMLARGVWKRHQMLAADREELHIRVSDGYRRLYLALPNEGAERPRLLVQMLSDRTATLRDLGLDILWREISAGKTIDSTVVDAAMQLLLAPDPQIRARAAVLVTQFAPPDVAAQVSAALERETSAEAAASLLIAVSRWPTATAIEPALRWLEQSPTEFPAAIDALQSMHARGLLTNPDYLRRAATALRSIPTSSLTPNACRLLAVIGNEDDRRRIAELLAGPSSSARSAAADALAVHPEFLEPILAAAMYDSALFNTAVRAVMQSRPTAAGFAAIKALPARTPQLHREGLIRTSLLLPLHDLLEASRSLGDDPELGDAVLSRLAEPGVPGTPGEAIVDTKLLCEALFLLADARLDLDRPDRALAALATLPEPLPDGVDAARARRLRVIALVWTNQLDLAAAENAPCADWLRALEHAFAEAHASLIIEEIHRQFETAMTNEELQRLETLAAKVRNAAIGQAPERAEPTRRGL